MAYKIGKKNTTYKVGPYSTRYKWGFFFSPYRGEISTSYPWKVSAIHRDPHNSIKIIGAHLVEKGWDLGRIHLPVVKLRGETATSGLRGSCPEIKKIIIKSRYIGFTHHFFCPLFSWNDLSPQKSSQKIHGQLKLTITSFFWGWYFFGMQSLACSMKGSDPPSELVRSQGVRGEYPFFGPCFGNPPWKFARENKHTRWMHIITLLLSRFFL